MAVTMKDLARRLKTTQATVSRALRGDSSIGLEMQQRVKQLAREMEYRPNLLAQSLVRGKTYTIGVLVHTLKTHFFTDFFTYFEEVCFQNGYTVLIASTEYNTDRESRGLQTFLDRRADALVVARSNPGTHDAILTDFLKNNGPVVLLGEDDVPDLPYYSVAFSEPLIGHLAAEHLWSLGHRRVAYLSATRANDQSVRMHKFRGDLFRRAWKALSGQDNVQQFEVVDTFYGGNEILRELKDTPVSRMPTAIACSTDRLALSTLAALQGHGLQVPRDISIIGCDDIDTAGEASVPLTTIRLSSQKLASEVWDLLRTDLNRTASGHSKQDHPRRIVEPEVVVRSSTGRIEMR